MIYKQKKSPENRGIFSFFLGGIPEEEGVFTYAPKSAQVTEPLSAKE